MSLLNSMAAMSTSGKVANSFYTMIERTKECFGLWPERLIADTAYGPAELLGWLVEEHGIEPYIPVIDKANRTDGTFSHEDFIYDHRTDAYINPAGNKLLQHQRIFQTIRPKPKETGIMRYSALKADCEACELKQRCPKPA